MIRRLLDWLGPPRDLPEEFRRETEELVLGRLRIGLLLGIVFIPAFLVVDTVRLPHAIGQCFLIRLAGTAALALLLPLTTLRRARGWAHPIAAVGLAAIAVPVLLIGRLGAGAADPVYLVQAMAVVFIIMGAGILFPVDGLTMTSLGLVPLVTQTVLTLDFDPALNLPVLSSSVIAVAIAAVGARSTFRHRLGDYEGRRAKEALLETRSELVAVLSRDLAARREAEEILRKSEQKYRALFEDLKDAVLLVSPRARLVDVNPAGLELFGYESKEELLATDIRDLYFDAARDRPPLIEGLRRDGFVKDLEVALRRRDGRRLHVMLTSTLVRDDQGTVTGARILLRDMTEHRRMEARLRHAQKLEAVGLLAAGVAHEINNPLTYVLSDLELVRAGLDELANGDDDGALASIRERVGEAQEGAERVRRIVRDLKTFSRMDEERRTAVDVNEVLRKTIGIASSELRYRATLETRLDPVPPVLASEGRLSQVFLNLLINAVQSFEERTDDRNRISVRTRLDGTDVVAEIADTGRGIPAADLDKLFDPFFTTKPLGVGSGLGLSICYNLIESYGGRIEVESREGEGSHFTVRLPAATPARDAAAPPVAECRVAGTPSNGDTPRGRVLIVDDEPRVLATAKLILGRSHEVVGAESGRAALDVLDRNREIDVILCDLMMRDVSGMELYDHLRETAPDLARRMVFMTGGAFTPSAREFLGKVPNARIEKPFSAADLQALIDQALNGSA